ncbi:hypothetical protein [uncultured Campylobacter sp.]|uniref:hypothetical protein n=1 Tax=uncultured Campylobacter sp. TaxID=218934 RepID=UPI002637EE8C|nr:hypothetical protein [uncultured Campylobacter sp.]
MKKFTIFCILNLTLYGYEIPKYSIDETKFIMNKFHEAFLKCDNKKELQRLSKELKEAFYPLSDKDLDKIYEPKFIEELRELSVENMNFILFALSKKKCSLGYEK